MKFKFLVVCSLVALVLATYFFRTQNDDTPAPSLAKPDISAEVSGIRAVQTNEQTGQIEYELTAERLTQNSKTGRDELVNAKLFWLPVLSDGTTEQYEIIAPLAYLDNTTGEFIFEQGFTLDKTQTDNHPTLHLTGQVLLGNIKEKILESHEPLTLTKGDEHFEAESFKADLNTGVYEFEQISIEFAPPQRTDKPLF